MTPFDSYGLFRWRDGDESNSALWCAEWLVAGGEWGEIMQGIKSCQAFRSEPGLYRRHPVHFASDVQSPDNLVGLGVIAHRGGPWIAKDIINYLWRHRGMYRIEPGCPWYREWMYRFPSVICHLNWCAGRRPPWWQRVAWAVSVAFKLDRTKHDSHVLSWLLIEVAGDKGWLEKWATRRFWRRFPWPSVADLMADYFKSQEHPIVLKLRENEKQ